MEGGLGPPGFSKLGSTVSSKRLLNSERLLKQVALKTRDNQAQAPKRRLQILKKIRIDVSRLVSKIKIAKDFFCQM